MQLKWTSRLASFFWMISTLVPLAIAKPKTDVKFRVNYYSQSDGSGSRGGNPRIDEDFSVIESIVIASHSFSRTLREKVKVTYDYIETGNDPAVTSGASQKATIDRIGVNSSTTYTVRSSQGTDSTFSLILGFSHEKNRYLSFQVGGAYSQEFLMKNLVLTLGFHYFKDTVFVIRYNNVDEGNEPKDTFNTYCTLTYIFTPTTVGSLFLNYTHQEKFLERPGNFVALQDPNTLQEIGRYYEELPGNRERVFLGCKLKQYLRLLDGSFHVSYRYYFDTFRIDAHVISLFYYQHFGHYIVTRLRYRFYTQTESKYYKEIFTTLPTYRTQDAIQSSFHSHTFGLEFIVINIHYHFLEFEFDFAFDFYTRSDSIEGYMVSGGAVISF